jgi:alkylation response protein AidB-like acyl-CoA dehydrogenase
VSADLHGELFRFSARGLQVRDEVAAFIESQVRPAQHRYDEQHQSSADRWNIPPIIEELKAEARSRDLWNLFLTDSPTGLSNLDYAPVAELTGRIRVAAEVLNCNAPDSGNMELLNLYGSDRQKEQWLEPLLRGQTRSGFMMTEPDVASSDATNVSTRIRRDGEQYVIDGRKWWITNAGDPVPRSSS